MKAELQFMDGGIEFREIPDALLKWDPWNHAFDLAEKWITARHEKEPTFGNSRLELRAGDSSHPVYVETGQQSAAKP